jgi:hypothetical protein
VAAVVGVVVALVLAQVIDGRVAMFTGLGTVFALTSWQHGSRQLIEYLGIAVAAAAGLGVFFLLIGTGLFASSAILAWAALLAGVVVAWWLASQWSARVRVRQVNSMVATTAKELGMSPEEGRRALELSTHGDRDTLIAEFTAKQAKQREELLKQGIDVASMEPEVGKLIGWDQIRRHVFRVLDFDRAGTTIGPDERVTAGSATLPYGYLRVESPILNQPARMPIVHSDDFRLAASVYDEPSLIGSITNGGSELLVTYAPKKVLAGGLNGTPDHCLHFLLCPPGTLERYYPNAPEGDRRMARPEPETLFGPFVYQGAIQVRVNMTPTI